MYVGYAETHTDASGPKVPEHSECPGKNLKAMLCLPLRISKSSFLGKVGWSEYTRFSLGKCWTTTQFQMPPHTSTPHFPLE